MGIVYHYTDPQAFKGVVEKAALWATDFRYLNDSRELTYTWTAFIEKLESLGAHPSEHSEAYRAQIEALRLLNARDLMHFDDAMFVACFSKLPDAISQWTGYGARGHGLALGFDSDKISMLHVPQYKHDPNGRLIPMTTILGGGPASGETVGFEWGAYMQQVAYGDAARDRVVDGLITTVERLAQDSGSFDANVANCISQTHAFVHRLPLVKHSDFKHEQEHRITITEHAGGKSQSQKRALSSLGKPFAFAAQGALETVDVQFRSDTMRMFKPYVSLPFRRDALVKVTTGPLVKHQLVEATVRRVLDRNGFRHTMIEPSQSPLQA